MSGKNGGRDGLPPETPDAAEVENRRIPMGQIAPHPRNYNQHPAEQLAKLKASLIRFGQVRSAVVQATVSPTRYMMVAGHGIWTAAGELGLPILKCDVIPVHWSDTQVEAYLVADNRLAEGGVQDEVMLAEILAEQRNAGFDLASMGSSDEDLDALLARLAEGALGGDLGLGDDDATGPDDDGAQDGDSAPPCSAVRPFYCATV